MEGVRRGGLKLVSVLPCFLNCVEPTLRASLSIVLFLNFNSRDILYRYKRRRRLYVLSFSLQHCL